MFLLITRILASIFAVFFILAFLPKLVSGVIEAFRSGEWEGMVMKYTFYVFLAGFIVSWWKKCFGGWIILFASIIQMGPFLIIDGNLGSLIFGIPLFVIGLMFLLYCLDRSRSG